MVNLSGAWVFKEFVGYIDGYNTGLNVIGIISLNLATALSDRHLEKEFFICGMYSDNEKPKVIKLRSVNRIMLKYY